MIVNAISAKVNFGKTGKTAAQIGKIVKENVGKDAKVAIQRHALSIWIPGREGKIIVNGSGDALTLAQDFAKVQQARNAGLLKPRYVDKIGL